MSGDIRFLIGLKFWARIGILHEIILTCVPLRKADCGSREGLLIGDFSDTLEVKKGHSQYVLHTETWVHNLNPGKVQDTFSRIVLMNGVFAKTERVLTWETLAAPLDKGKDSQMVQLLVPNGNCLQCPGTMGCKVYPVAKGDKRGLKHSTGLHLIFVWVTNSSNYNALLARSTTGAQQRRWPGDTTARTKTLKCNLKRRCIWTDTGKKPGD
ncbi:hypothetical protein WISP_96164 [Willisornis vidua]|uniref:Uncharacterized protein n=1 Tax=Willisornis vidua TaxID=1566151 RepID=A0ABQ9D5S8_9PASS|nr:hypothetical protein WISP_96164 [Willisornis vidua]